MTHSRKKIHNDPNRNFDPCGIQRATFLGTASPTSIKWWNMYCTTELPQEDIKLIVSWLPVFTKYAITALKRGETLHRKTIKLKQKTLFQFYGLPATQELMHITFSLQLQHQQFIEISKKEKIDEFHQKHIMSKTAYWLL